MSMYMKELKFDIRYDDTKKLEKTRFRSSLAVPFSRHSAEIHAALCLVMIANQ